MERFPWGAGARSEPSGRNEPCKRSKVRGSKLHKTQATNLYIAQNKEREYLATAKPVRQPASWRACRGRGQPGSRPLSCLQTNHPADQPGHWPGHWPAGYSQLPAQLGKLSAWAAKGRPGGRPTSWPASWPSGRPAAGCPAGQPPERLAGGPGQPARTRFEKGSETAAKIGSDACAY